MGLAERGRPQRQAQGWLRLQWFPHYISLPDDPIRRLAGCSLRRDPLIWVLSLYNCLIFNKALNVGKTDITLRLAS